MTPRDPVHKSYNTLPAIIRSLDAIQPIDIFTLFLTPALLETVSTHTNAYASQNRGEGSQSSGRVWRDVSADEIGCWLGIVVYMGVHCSPAIADYWKHDGLYPKHPIAEWMSQTRFEQIKRYFHVSSPDIELHTTTHNSPPFAHGGLCSFGPSIRCSPMHFSSTMTSKAPPVSVTKSSLCSAHGN
jgi:hypothetical protein